MGIAMLICVFSCVITKNLQNDEFRLLALSKITVLTSYQLRATVFNYSPYLSQLQKKGDYYGENLIKAKTNQICIISLTGLCFVNSNVRQTNKKFISMYFVTFFYIFIASLAWLWQWKVKIFIISVHCHLSWTLTNQHNVQKRYVWLTACFIINRIKHFWGKVSHKSQMNQGKENFLPFPCTYYYFVISGPK